MSGMVNQSSAYAAGGVVPTRMGNAHPSVVPYEPLPTADNDLIVAAANDGLFRKLVVVLGLPELADDPRFLRNADRTEHREELRPILIEALAAKGAEEWFDLLVDAGVPCGPINSVAGGFAIAERFGLDPIVSVGRGRARGAHHPQPDPLLRHARGLRAAAAGARRARRGAAAWLATPEGQE